MLSKQNTAHRIVLSILGGEATPTVLILSVGRAMEGVLKLASIGKIYLQFAALHDCKAIHTFLESLSVVN